MKKRINPLFLFLFPLYKKISENPRIKGKMRKVEPSVQQVYAL